ncbi:multidrug DMT transporter permease [Salinicola corii]|uniref:Multidrug DMT transporter permease n=1 Tax=Salinicola corii TaxID=2606937 RepID=A0A640WJ27_9GAMM|nr:iron uptake system protein EfeO [Salinicola corii]KAA0020577.1 multidrug DMT transporter permease [Salinicola corii]
MSQSASIAPPSPRTLRLGMAVSFLLMLIALGVFTLSLRAANPVGDDGQVIEVTASGCEPNRLEVPAGQRTFTVVNRSDRAIEWEIIDGVMVLAERENIAPGLRQPLTATLKAGDYVMTCGLLSNPRGTLHVVAGDSSAPASTLPATAFVGPLAEYQVYTTLQLRKLRTSAVDLRDAVAADDLDAARRAYREARRIDLHLAMPIGLYSDIDQRLNARADDFEQREADPAFVGFHRLAAGLFGHQGTAGLNPVAAQLVADVDTLAERLKHASIPPAQLAAGTSRVLEAWLDHHRDDSAIAGRDLADLVALTEGADKIVSLLSPLLEHRSPAVQQTLQANLKALQRDLPAAINSSTPSGVAAGALLQATGTLADSLAGINQTLTLEG